MSIPTSGVDTGPVTSAQGRRAARRLDGVGSTIFAEMSALAVRTGSVNLGQGFPDLSGPAAVIEQVHEAMLAGRNQYPPGHGSPELVEAVIGHQRRHYGLELAPEQVVVTTGATEAIAAAMLGLVDPGDEVLVCEPFYDSYRAMIQFCWRRTAAADAARSRLPPGPRRAGWLGDRPLEGDPAQHPAQPDRPRPRRRASSPVSLGWRRSTTWSSSPTRSTST